MAQLRERLQDLDSSNGPPSSLVHGENTTNQQSVLVLPSIDRHVSNGVEPRSRKKTPPNYRDVMEAIRRLRSERQTLADPHMANLKVPIGKTDCGEGDWRR